MQSYDVVIAGGGMSGFLAAVQLAGLKSGATIHLIEAEKHFGGRLRSSRRELSRWGFGNNIISRQLFEFLSEKVRGIYPQWSMDQYLVHGLTQVSFCSGGKANIFQYHQLLDSLGFKAMGGRTAAKEWSEMEGVFSADSKISHESVGKSLSIKKTGASGTVLSQVAKVLGIPDVWNTSTSLLKSKSEALRDYKDFQVHGESSKLEGEGFCEPFLAGYFDDMIDDTLELLHHDKFISVAKQCRLLDVRQDGDVWILQTEKGPIQTRKIIMALDPWTLMSAMTREMMPVAVSNMALKSKPVSIVSLSSQIVSGELDSDCFIIASEDVQVLKHGDTVTFQATIDYEMSLDAPEVVKAVKRLKRSAKKLVQYAPGLEIKGEFVGLVPVAWCQPTNSQDHKFIERMANLNSSSLAFVGEAYGTSYNGDRNIMEVLSSLNFGLGSGGLSDSPIIRKSDLASASM